MEDRCGLASDLPEGGIVRSIVADEPEKFRRILPDVLYLEVQPLGPLTPLPGGLAEGIAISRQVHQNRAELLVYLPLVEEAAAHPHDEGEVFVHHRALLHAGQARSASPELLRRDRLPD